MREFILKLLMGKQKYSTFQGQMLINHVQQERINQMVRRVSELEEFRDSLLELKGDLILQETIRNLK